MHPRTVLALLVLLGALSGALLLAGGAAALHDDDQTDTVTVPTDRDPGAEEVSYVVASNLTDDIDNHPHVDYPEYVRVTVPEANFDECAGGTFSEASYELGVNRSNSGYEAYDVGDESFDGESVNFSFDSDDQPTWGQGDRVELVFDECAVNADEEDWYQLEMEVQGVSRGGDDLHFETTSHYFGICEGCEDDGDAVDEMGPPPSYESPTPRPTPEPTASPTPTRTEAPSTSATPTDTPEPSPSPTAEPTDTPTAGGDDAGDAEFLGVDPFLVVGAVAAVSAAIAALGARRL